MDTVASFTPHHGSGTDAMQEMSSSGVRRAAVAAAKDDRPRQNSEKKELGLLTFDLDDTLFPIGPVVADANDAMINAMTKLGYHGITNEDVLSATRHIRKEISARNTVITYTELRMRAIRSEMERFLAQQFSVEADEGETLHPSIVQYVFDAWLEERNASASRRLFRGALSMLETIKSLHPSVVIGAVTNGRGDPLDMPSTLGPHFDFCVSGEDEGVFPHRKPHKGIYDAAWAQYEQLVTSKDCNGNDFIWVHVGDDLANDVGASAKCGAKAVWLSMTEEEDLGSTMNGVKAAAKRPSWSTATREEVARRRKMAELARTSISAEIEVLGQLPGAVDKILCEY